MKEYKYESFNKKYNFVYEIKVLIWNLSVYSDKLQQLQQ